MAVAYTGWFLRNIPSDKIGFRVARSRRPEKEEKGGEGEGGAGAEEAQHGGGVEGGRGDEEGTMGSKEKIGAAGLRAMLKEEGGRRGGGGGKDGEAVKGGRGRSSRLRRRGWSEEGKAYRPRSEMTRRSKERKGRGGGGSSSRGGEEGDGGGVKGSSSQSLSGSHSSLGRAGEDSLMAGEDLLMVRRYRTRGRSLGAGTGNRVNEKH